MNVLIENSQRCLIVRTAAVKRAVQAMSVMARTAEGGAAWGDLSIALVDDRGIIEWNRRLFGKSHPTDVISIGYPRPGAEGQVCDGEICINAERALAVGPRYGGVARELALYLAHGINHLTGADDHAPEGRRRMRRRELRWLGRLEAGLPEDLTAAPKRRTVRKVRP
jgi:rRNA maturation RNase YbeY